MQSTDAVSYDAASFVSVPDWMSKRYWENAETTRLNSAHWLHAKDESINSWLLEHLETLRARSIYEARNNSIVLGMISTHADDIVGQDGPTLQVQSDDAAYNDALENVWAQWFSAPTPRPNVSGAALMKLWIRNLWRCGEFLATMITVDTDGPVAMRIKPIHPRRLCTPFEMSGDGTVIMGIRFDVNGTPSQYFIADEPAMGTDGKTVDVTPYPPDLVIHEFLFEEEDQVRGVPIQASSLQSSADLRDYDDQVQDAARQIADQSCLLYSDHPDAQFFAAPESADIERRTIRMVPPGWKPFTYQSVQPPVQYPDYRAERQIEMGRPVGMPRLMVRLDASKHSWASARLDMTTYRRSVACLQAWLSGSAKSVGVLSRLVDEVAREARFRVPQLRLRPRNVEYQWTWPQLDDVEPVKTQQAQQIGLTTGTLTLTDILTSKKKTLRQHIEEMARERAAFEAAGVPLPSWMASESSDEVVEDVDSDTAEAVEAAMEGADA